MFVQNLTYVGNAKYKKLYYSEIGVLKNKNKLVAIVT